MNSFKGHVTPLIRRLSMNRFLVRTALFAIIASPALSHADTFTLTWGSSNRQTLTFYLPQIRYSRRTSTVSGHLVPLSVWTELSIQRT